jgi:hypothetical protein
MEPTPRRLLAWMAELRRMEERVWARNPEEAAGERASEMLTYLMTEAEWRRWRAVGAVVAHMRKLI